VIGKVAFCFIYFFIDCFMSGKMFHFGAIKQLIASWKAISSSIIMAVSLLLINSLLLTENILKLIIMILSGVMIYFLCLVLLHEDEVVIIMSRIGKKEN